MKSVDPYSVLARGYDFVMQHVDYPGWAQYVHELIEHYGRGPDTPIGSEPLKVLELGCGTAAIGVELSKLGYYSYTGTDRSQAMIDIARSKRDEFEIAPTFCVQDYLERSEVTGYDIVLLIYDGMNYLLDPSSIDALLVTAWHAARRGGLFLMDQSTPANSENNADYFEDEGEFEGFKYLRQSEYDSETNRHKTRFEINDGQHQFAEEHLQRAYSLSEIRKVIERSGFDIVAALDGFTAQNASEQSERIQWILQRPIK